MVLCNCTASDATIDRSARRSYDGAPPTIPHELFGIACVECHTRRSVTVAGYDPSPIMPHTEGGAFTNCKQCHVPAKTRNVFQPSRFEPLLQDLRPGNRAHPGAPPTIPHRVFMRENCLVCHAGTGSREEIRTTHPERTRCRQCHAESVLTVDWGGPDSTP
jgi:cytochrome c-type protein NapB